MDKKKLKDKIGSIVGWVAIGAVTILMVVYFVIILGIFRPYIKQEIMLLDSGRYVVTTYVWYHSDIVHSSYVSCGVNQVDSVVAAEKKKAKKHVEILSKY